ncbi:MAG: hypothetical protein IPG90_20955 [Bacteroidetes bacterium]|nr:hypothetical protein [Bacteroidota bacterium]
MGAILTNRYNTNSSQTSGQTIGWDIVQFLNRQVVLVGGMVGTFRNLNFTPTGSRFFSNPMYYELALFRSAREGWFYTLQGDCIGKDFNPEMGFIAENDLWNANVGFGHQFKASSSSTIQYYSLSTNTNFKAKISSGTTETRYVDLTSEITWKSGAYLSITPISWQEDRIFDAFQLGNSITIHPDCTTCFHRQCHFRDRKINAFMDCSMLLLENSMEETGSLSRRHCFEFHKSSLRSS